MTTIRIIDNNNRAGEVCINDIAIDDLDLSFLVGSPKQINWASRIITDALIAMVKTYAVKDCFFATPEQAAQIVEFGGKIAALAMTAAAKKASAGWWIDNRMLAARLIFDAANK